MSGFIEFCCPKCGLRLLAGDHDDNGKTIPLNPDWENGVMNSVRLNLDEKSTLSNVFMCPRCRQTSSIRSWRDNALDNMRPVHADKKNWECRCCGLFVRSENAPEGFYRVIPCCLWCGSHSHVALR